MSDFHTLLAEAKGVTCAKLLERRGRDRSLRKQGAELVGPCPACGGVDRFAVSIRKNIWHCRRSGRGGDVIALVEYLDGCDFLTALETLTGRRPEREPTREEKAERERSQAEDRARREREENRYRQGQIERAKRIWQEAEERGVAEAYLAHRGLTLPVGAKVRGHRSVIYYERLEGGHEAGSAGGATGRRYNRPEQIFAGPAMVAAILGIDGRFEGAHVTWVDPRLMAGRPPLDPKGKARIVHPQTGEVLPAKKVIGSARAGHIHLGGPDEPRRLVIGEGIETVLAVRAAFTGLDGLLAETAFWASVSLQNLGGKAQCMVPHPSAKKVDSAGRERALRVPGPEPLFDLDHPALMPPESATEIVTLGDGDSDRFTAEQVHARATARWAAPGRTIRTAWAAEGKDFNDMLQEAGAPK